MPTMAAMGKAFRIQDCSLAVYPRLGRYPKISGNQAPQMKNSSTIIRISLNRTVLFIRCARWQQPVIDNGLKRVPASQPVSRRLGRFESFSIVAREEFIRIDGLVVRR